MRAVVLVKHGPPERALEVREWPEPTPGPDELLVDVRPRA
jgi:NADPH:quinone reductase-like Zn-dependent oxidoreductase